MRNGECDSSGTIFSFVEGIHKPAETGRDWDPGSFPGPGRDFRMFVRGAWEVKPT